MQNCFKHFKEESFFCGVSSFEKDFYTEVKNLLDAALSGAPSTSVPVWLRFHLSDIANQEDILRRVLNDSSCRFAVAVTGQAPLCGAHAGLEAYFFDRNAVSYPVSGRSCIENAHYRQYFFNTPHLESSGSGPQMHEEFMKAEKVITSLGGNIPENLQRTWIYCRDIDNNYADLVVARRELFTVRGLTSDTHYITSTGIEGMAHPHNRLVRMDSMALFGHSKEQIQYLQALDNLSPTHVYGVTFERGTRIIYGDRSHYYISGTASIDREGKVMYEQDVEKQTLRIIENISALLEEGGGSLEDLCQLVIYLRDPADYPRVKPILDRHLPEKAVRLPVRGSICRPAWLVEIEAIAANSRGDERFAPFGIR